MWVVAESLGAVVLVGTLVLDLAEGKAVTKFREQAVRKRSAIIDFNGKLSGNVNLQKQNGRGG